MDIIAAIDRATGCQQCNGPLDDSPSDDFCGQDCQQAWAASRTAPLVGYREPIAFDPSDYTGFRRRWMLGVSEAFALPAVPAVPLPPASGQVYVAGVGTLAEHVPGDGWHEIGTVDGDVVLASTTPEDASPIRDLLAFYVQRRIDLLAPAFEQMGRAVVDALSAIETLGEVLKPLLPPAPPADPRERALWLRQHRNTGPAQRQRPPRAITPRRAR